MSGRSIRPNLNIRTEMTFGENQGTGQPSSGITEGSAISKGKRGGLKFTKLKETPKNSPCFRKRGNDDTKSNGSRKKMFSTPSKIKNRDLRKSLPHDFN